MGVGTVALSWPCAAHTDLRSVQMDGRHLAAGCAPAPWEQLPHSGQGWG